MTKINNQNYTEELIFKHLKELIENESIACTNSSHIIFPPLLSMLDNNEENQLKLIDLDADFLTFISNPTEKVILTAVQKNGRLIKYMENPSVDVQIAAVRSCFDAFNYIKNPDQEVIKELVIQDGSFLEFIIKPSYEIQKIAVMKNPSSIQYIIDQTEELQLIVIEKNLYHAIRYIRWDCNFKVLNTMIDKMLQHNTSLSDIKRILRYYNLTSEHLSKLHGYVTKDKDKLMIRCHPLYKDDASLILDKIEE